jgi:histidinol-phosphate aminotransferase
MTHAHSDFLQNAKAHVLDMSPYQTASPLSRLKSSGRGSVINLASNENPFPPSDAMQALLQRMGTHVQRYPDPTGVELKHGLAKYLSIQPEKITLCNGSSEGIALLVQLFAGPGDHVILADTAYALYETCVKSQGAQVIKISDRDWTHNLLGMQDAITPKTTMILLANPNNPTGTFIKHQELQAFLQAIPKQIIVVLDEAYFDYVDDEAYPNSLLLQESHENLVISRSFSKAYALAGLRIGYCLAHPKLSDLLNRIRLSFNVNSIALEAAKLALQRQDEMQQMVTFVRSERTSMQLELSRIGVQFIPACANFILMNFQDKADQIFHYLLEQGILIRQLKNYQLPHHLRVTIGTAEENQRLLQALAGSLS